MVKVANGSTTQSERLQTQVERNLSRQDTSASDEGSGARWYVERKNGQNGGAYESYEAYIRRRRQTHCECLDSDLDGGGN